MIFKHEKVLIFNLKKMIDRKIDKKIILKVLGGDEKKIIKKTGMTLDQILATRNINQFIGMWIIKLFETMDELILKGRERQHPGKAKETIAAFIKEVEKDEALNLYREQDLTKQGGRYTIILANKTS